MPVMSSAPGERKGRTPPAGRGALVALALALVAAVVVAYLPAMSGGFAFDDEPNIVDNAAVHWDELSLANARRAISDSTLPSRIVSNLSFGLNHRVSGLAPAAYHWTNLAIHLAVVAALCWVAILFATAAGARRRASVLAALAATALFALHPLNSQPVSYIVQRMTLLAALFSVLALGAYVRARTSATATRGGRALWFAVALGCWVLALLSKENAATLLLVVAIYELCFHARAWRQWLAGRWRGGAAQRVALLGAAAAAVALLAWLGIDAARAAGFALGPLDRRDFTGLERVLTQSRVQLHYFTLLVWPSPDRLTLDHDFAVSHSLLDPWSTLFACALWLAVGAGAAWVAWRGRRPVLAWAVLSYIALQSVEAGPISLELVFEHRMYLPLTALAILLATWLATLPARRRRVAIASVFTLAAVLAVPTYARNRTWGEPLTLLYDAAAKAPNKPRPQYNLGRELAIRGNYAEAEPYLQRAIAIAPDHSAAHNALGNVYRNTNRWELALDHFLLAVRHDPDNASATYNAGVAYDTLGRTDLALSYYRRFLAMNDSSQEAARRWVVDRLAQLRRGPR